MKIFFVSLGCDKNLVDSEKMLALVSGANYEITDDESQAEIIIVNTCCFIHDAKEESIETLIEMGQWKTNGKCKVLIAAGCLAQRYAQEITSELSEVDGIVGTTAFDQIVPVIEKALQSNGVQKCLENIDRLPVGITQRVNSAGGATSYLKIAEGCDKHCTYCIIPKLRGNFRSVPIEELMEEARGLAKQGTTELILVAQETTLYGMDLYQEKQLPLLLDKLSEIAGIEWIRILYCYPEEINEQLIFAIRDNEKVCHYIDMPIQHCNDEILKKMGRKTSKAELVEKVELLRKYVPDIALRTTLITGFPSETQEQHEELLEFVQTMKFHRLGVFTYSEEEGTPAATMEGQIEEEVKMERLDQLMNAQRDVVFSYNEGLVSQRLEVFVEGYLPDEKVYIGRTYMDAPNVDGNIFVETQEELISGQKVEVLVTDANGYDLIGILA